MKKNLLLWMAVLLLAACGGSDTPEWAVTSAEDSLLGTYRLSSATIKYSDGRIGTQDDVAGGIQGEIKISSDTFSMSYLIEDEEFSYVGPYQIDFTSQTSGVISTSEEDILFTVSGITLTFYHDAMDAEVWFTHTKISDSANAAASPDEESAGSEENAASAMKRVLESVKPEPLR